jgi:hypothetical protein
LLLLKLMTSFMNWNFHFVTDVSNPFNKQ